MDTGSISRLDLQPASAPAVAPASAPVSEKSPAVSNAPVAARTPTKTEVKNSVDAINRFLEDTSEVHFSIDEDSGISVVKVIDTETKKVLQQFPSEQSLEIGKNLSTKGLLINSEA